jgi:hypothetical protein
MASMTSDATVNMSDVAKSMSITVRVKGVRIFHFRMWLTIQILKLAALVAPVSTFVEIEGP